MSSWALACLTVVVLSACVTSVPEKQLAAHDILAAWEGGELSTQDFIENYDPREVALKSGGRHLDAQICRAAYHEIYGDLAADPSLAADSELISLMRSFREGRLAGLYIDAHMPAGMHEPDDAAVQAYFEAHTGDFNVVGSAAIGVIFVRCSEDADQRDAGFARMQVIKDQVQIVDSPGKAELEPLILEEKEISGPANGFFRSVRFDRLAQELRAVVETTPVGSFSEVVETPIGLFWIWVADRRDGSRQSLEQATTRIRSILRSDNELRWKAGESERLGPVTGGDTESEVFSNAAIAEGLDVDPVFVAAEKFYQRQRLLELAFARDAAMVPSDTEFEEQLAADPRKFANYLVYWLDILVVEPQRESYAAQQIAARISARLHSGDAIDVALIADEMPGVVAYKLGPLNLSLMRIVNPGIEALAKTTDVGQWNGPVALDDPYSLLVIVGGGEEITVPQLEDGLAFFVVKRRDFPPVSEIRPRLITNFRQSLFADPEECLKAFQERWNLEVVQ